MKKRVWFIMFCVLVTTGGWLLGCSGNEEEMNALKSMDPQQVMVFRIYPRVIRPSGTSIEFNVPDPIIEDFFHALRDIRPYPTFRGGTVVSWDHNWFLEAKVTDSKKMIQIAFRIPSQQGNIVLGGIGEFTETGGHYDGSFQSELLFQWYQKYKDLWLTPVTPPGATATPTPL